MPFPAADAARSLRRLVCAEQLPYAPDEGANDSRADEKLAKGYSLRRWLGNLRNGPHIPVRLLGVNPMRFHSPSGGCLSLCKNALAEVVLGHFGHLRHQRIASIGSDFGVNGRLHLLNCPANASRIVRVELERRNRTVQGCEPAPSFFELVLEFVETRNC